MPWPIRHLPVIQQWDCHACGQCCKDYRIDITEAERARIDSQNWQADPSFKDVAPYVPEGGGYRLNQRDDGSCVFLGDTGRCRIHEKFGPEGKPLACRIYPFVFIPCGDHWRVGMRFACPSATSNLGPNVSEHLPDLRKHLAEIERRESVASRDVQPPKMQSGQSVAWPDMQRFVQAMDVILAKKDQPIEFRLRKCLALESLCRKAKFDAVAGKRLDEFLELMIVAIDADLPRSGELPGEPSKLSWLVFRMACGLHIRRDTGPRRGLAAQGASRLFFAALRFARGKGPVPQMHGWMPQITFEQLETIVTPSSQQIEQLWERFFRVKIQSLQFAGPTNHGRDFWDGLDSLLLVYPIATWLARSFTDMDPLKATERALQMVDDNFGYSRMLGTRRLQVAIHWITARGDLGRLVHHYGSAVKRTPE